MGQFITHEACFEPNIDDDWEPVMAVQCDP